jgi:hypothetical protein
LLENKLKILFILSIKGPGSPKSYSICHCKGNLKPRACPIKFSDYFLPQKERNGVTMNWTQRKE